MFSRSLSKSLDGEYSLIVSVVLSVNHLLNENHTETRVRKGLGLFPCLTRQPLLSSLFVLFVIPLNVNF